MRNMGCEDFSKAMGVKEEMNAEAEITDIQRFSVHDGTGIRTLVFFKGCARSFGTAATSNFCRTPIAA